MYHIYFLRSLSNPDEIYTGMSNDPLRRLEEHNRGESNHTKKNIPWTIEATVTAENETTAFIVEKYFKNSSGKEKFTNFAKANPKNPNPKQGFFDELEEGRAFGKKEKRFVYKRIGSLKYFAMANQKD